MSQQSFTILEVSRMASNGETDSLPFTNGVNVLVGPPNTGKSKWLRMLDFLLGSSRSAAEAFGEDLADKYESISAVVRIGDSEHLFERKWKQYGSATKVLVDEIPHSLPEFYDFIMTGLQIPVIHFPQGNPLGPRTWPELSWRSLFRHMYRRQGFWTDIADQQPESEQHACLLQFLGIADRVFSEEFQQLALHQKRVVQLQTEKDQFVDMLERVTHDILKENEVGVLITPASIATALDRIESEIGDIEVRRGETLSELYKSQNPVNERVVQDLGQKLASLNIDRETMLNELLDAESRLDQLRTYSSSIVDEQNRMQRAVEAGSVLADLKVTNCPVCDRSITPDHNDEHHCYLCQRELSDNSENSAVGKQRLEFELEQLRGEVLETDELIGSLLEDIESRRSKFYEIESEIRLTQDLLKPSRTAVTAILPPEIHVLDVEMGRLQERREQLVRIQRTLHQRANLTDEIQQIEDDLIDLEHKILEQGRGIPFEGLSDVLSEGMNGYLSMISQAAVTSWTQGRVVFRISDRRFDFRIDEELWRPKLGGTLTNMFLLAYNYSLLSLAKSPDFNYPGLLILDFPAEIVDSSSVGEKENFVLDPFVDLVSQDGMFTTQVIAAGSSFEDLAGATRLELSRIWA